MLVEFRVANFRSFREEQVFSLVASKDDKVPGNLINTPRFNLLKSAAIYGANASGKSNLVKALRFFGWFVQVSATRMNQGDPIEGISPFRLDVASRTQPAVFEITVLIDESLYRYGFSATQERVHDEWLVVVPPGGRRQQGWFEREFNPETGRTDWSFRGPLKKDQDLLKERTRDNGLVLSRGAELNVTPLADLFLSLKNALRIFDSSAHTEGVFHTAMCLLRDTPDLADRIPRMMRHADLSIEDLRVSEEPSRPSDIFGPTTREVELAFQSFASGMLRLRLKTFHHMADSELLEEFDLLKDESQGTIQFFSLAVPLVQAIDSGATVFVDEIDCSMHPLLTRKLIELFQSPDVNTSGAQLVFTTHDSSLMDLDLFRRDQIWLAEKNSASATELTSLYDFEERPRNTEAVERNYLAGRYGGVPRFGATFEDLTLK